MTWLKVARSIAPLPDTMLRFSRAGQNLPTITPRYWTAILVASMAGANMGDFFSRNLHLGHTRGLLPLAAIFVVILWAENRAKIATEAYYWLAIIVVRTAAMGELISRRRISGSATY
jgi:uncharacterized membrane-anchored protein